MNVFVLFILIYLLYRFIGGFLIPLFRTTTHMRQQFHNMNNQQGRSSGQQPGANTSAPGGPGYNGNGSQQNGSNSGASKVGEYIDFEEIK